MKFLKSTEKRPPARDIPPGLFVEKGKATGAPATAPDRAFRPRAVPADVVDVDVVVLPAKEGPVEAASSTPAPEAAAPPPAETGEARAATPEPAKPLRGEAAEGERPAPTAGFTFKRKGSDASAKPSAAPAPDSSGTAGQAPSNQFFAKFGKSAQKRPAQADSPVGTGAPFVARLQAMLSKKSQPAPKADAQPSSPPAPTKLLGALGLSALMAAGAWQALAQQNQKDKLSLNQASVAVTEKRAEIEELTPRAIRAAAGTARLDVAGASRRAGALWAPGLAIELQVTAAGQVFSLVPLPDLRLDLSSPQARSALQALLAQPLFNNCAPAPTPLEGVTRVTITCQTDSARPGSGDRR